jgi:hypothetical protein
MERQIDELLGKTIVFIEQIENKEILFTTSEEKRYRMFHYQDCCECVRIDDINGDLNDLRNSPLLVAEERTQKPVKEYDDYDYGDSETWTFYTFATIKGYVTIKWYGTSNGYYSERVDFEEIGNDMNDLYDYINDKN